MTVSQRSSQPHSDSEQAAMQRQSRRDFLRAAVLAGTAVSAPGTTIPLLLAQEPVREASGKLNIAVIGVAARGAANLAGVAHENIVALCDIDDSRLEQAGKQFPDARRFNDFRELFDTMHDLDAVVVSTPDHMHAIPVSWALKRKLPVYCEKPLTHSVGEARQIRALTEKAGVVTQMGTQIHAGSNYRRVVETIRAGVIGPVRRVHVWQGGGVRTGQRVASSEVPKGMHYDLWTGPAPWRPFHPSHFHFNWRYWWDFGGGQLADFGCHYMDLPFWALDLIAPTELVAVGEKGHDGDNQCPNRMRVEYYFDARGDHPPVHLTWYHGGWKPAGAEEYGKSSAVLFEGEYGRLLADYGSRKLFMQRGREAKPVEPTIPDSIGHHAEWLRSIRTGEPTTCRFEYGSRLTETALLGNVSYRLGQKKLLWDGDSGKVTNQPAAGNLIQREYRDGWTLA